jgi:hypothetical protein
MTEVAAEAPPAVTTEQPLAQFGLPAAIALIGAR